MFKADSVGKAGEKDCCSYPKFEMPGFQRPVLIAEERVFSASWAERRFRE